MARPKTFLLPKRKPGTETCQKRGLPLNFVVSRLTITGKSVFRVSALRTASPPCFRVSLCSRPPGHTRTQRHLRPKATRRLPPNRRPIFNKQITTFNSSHNIGFSAFQQCSQQATKLRQQTSILHYATYKNEVPASISWHLIGSSYFHRPWEACN
jgi:hypothetical protein